MPQEQARITNISKYCIVATLGLITVSSRMMDNSVTTLNQKSAFTYGCFANVYSEDTVYNSSMLSAKAVGDILFIKQPSDFMQKHKKTNVNLQINKINKHVSSFDFEDEYEEI